MKTPWKSIIFLLIIGILLILFTTATIIFSIFLVIFGISMLTVPLTLLFGLVTGQSYDRVCDNSEIIYKLNQFGKWSIIISLGAFLTFGVYSFLLK